MKNKKIMNKFIKINKVILRILQLGFSLYNLTKKLSIIKKKLFKSQRIFGMQGGNNC